MKKKMKLIYIGVAIVSVVCLAVSAFLVKDLTTELGLDELTQPNQPEQTGAVLYKEPKNPTELQTELYESLLEATKNFPEEYDSFAVADCVVRSFIADFYTWTNMEHTII